MKVLTLIPISASVCLAYDRLLILYIKLQKGDVSGSLKAIEGWFNNAFGWVYEFFKPVLNHFLNLINGLEFFTFPLRLITDDWKHILVFLTIYFSPICADALRGGSCGFKISSECRFFGVNISDWTKGIYSFLIRTFGAISGILFAIFISILVSSYSTYWNQVLLLFASFAAGLLVFRIIFALQFALDMRIKRNKYWPNFFKKLKDIILFHGLLAAVFIIYIILREFVAFEHLGVLGFFVIVLSLLAMACGHLILSKEARNRKLLVSLKNYFLNLLKTGEHTDKNDSYSGHLLNGVKIFGGVIVCVLAILGFDFLG